MGPQCYETESTLQQLKEQSDLKSTVDQITDDKLLSI